MAAHEVRRKYLILYLCSFLAGLLLFFCRCLNLMNPDIVLLPEVILLHITNFSLSFIALLSFGFAMLVFGCKRLTIPIAALLIAAFNIGYEIVLPILRTPDIADAVSGLLGIVLAYLLLLILEKKGLTGKSPKE